MTPKTTPVTPAPTMGAAVRLAKGGKGGTSFIAEALDIAADYLLRNEDAVRGLAASPPFQTPSTKGKAGSDGHDFARAVTERQGWPATLLDSGDLSTDVVRSQARAVDTDGNILEDQASAAAKDPVWIYFVSRKGDWTTIPGAVQVDGTTVAAIDTEA